MRCWLASACEAPVVAPASTPAAVVVRLHEEPAAALRGGADVTPALA